MGEKNKGRKNSAPKPWVKFKQDEDVLCFELLEPGSAGFHWITAAPKFFQRSQTSLPQQLSRLPSAKDLPKSFPNVPPPAPTHPKIHLT